VLTKSAAARNAAQVKSLPCLVTGRPGVDACHFPKRRSHGGENTLLNLIPLCREWHRLVDDYHEPQRSIVTDLAYYFHSDILDTWDGDDIESLGKQWWEG